MPVLKEKRSSANPGNEKDTESPVFVLSKQLEENQSILLDFLDCHYDKFVPTFESSTQLSNRVRNLLQEVNEVSSVVQDKLLLDIDAAGKKREILDAQIVGLKCEAEVIEKLLKIDGVLNQLGKMNPRDSNEFEKFASLIVDGEELLSSLSHLKELDILPVLQLELANLKGDLTTVLLHMWHDLISWQTYDNENEATLVMQQISNLPKLAKVLEELGEYSLLIRQFSRKAFELVLKHVPVKYSEVVQKKLEETVHLRVKFKEPSCTFDDVSKSLLKFITPIRDILGNHTVDLMGCSWKSKLCELLIEKCLAPAVPSSSDKLQSFDEYISRTCELQESLKELGFLNSEDRMLSDYVHNVNFLYANKLCQEVLVNARRLIAEDLHDTVRLGPGDVGLVASTYQSKPSEEWEILASLGIDVNKSPFLFPECTISNSTLEILKLMKSTLMEAQMNGPDLAPRLEHVCRSIVDLYISTVPIVHKSVLSNLPQQSALAHNNCMYFGHVLMTINVSKVQFGMQAQNLRHLGAQIFLAQMRTQKTHLLTMLNDGGLNRLGSDGSLGPALEKAFRQCVLHLKHLRQVWQPVLPETVYAKAIGTLANSVLEEVISRVTTVEDIPSDVAVSLVAHGSFVTDALPSLFQSSEDDSVEITARIRRFVSRSEQFKELLKLLDASLRDVDDRWAAGSGPLALYFTADQVKHMIRALFQNTDLRAALLVKIK